MGHVEAVLHLLRQEPQRLDEPEALDDVGQVGHDQPTEVVVGGGHQVALHKVDLSEVRSARHVVFLHLD